MELLIAIIAGGGVGWFLHQVRDDENLVNNIVSLFGFGLIAK
jgi:hypothetical protein